MEFSIHELSVTDRSGNTGTVPAGMQVDARLITQKKSEARKNCYNSAAVMEGWHTHTSATAKIRGIKSAKASFILGADTGTATQHIFCNKK